MKRAVSAFSTVMALTWISLGTAIAQPAPAINHLTPLQRQQLSRALVPSSAQDFFSTGQATLEQEIRLLTRPRSSRENLLKMSQRSQVQPETQGEKPAPLQRDERSRGE